MMNSQPMRNSAVMMFSTTPSAKYSCSGSPLEHIASEQKLHVGAPFTPCR